MSARDDYGSLAALAINPKAPDPDRRDASRVLADIDRLRKQLAEANITIRTFAGGDRPGPTGRVTPEFDPWRRGNINRRTPIETAIADLIRQVEELGAHRCLTETVIRLGDAQDAFADWIDGLDEPRRRRLPDRPTPTGQVTPNHNGDDA